MKSEHLADKAVDLACRCGNCPPAPGLDHNYTDVARRGFLRSAITGAVVGVIAGTTVATPRQAAAQGAQKNTSTGRSPSTTRSQVAGVRSTTAPPSPPNPLSQGGRGGDSCSPSPLVGEGVGG